MQTEVRFFNAIQETHFRARCKCEFIRAGTSLALRLSPMNSPRDSLQPGQTPESKLRRRLSLTGELSLAFLPTVTILLVLALVEAFSKQRLLFASLASSAFLIYLDPEHGTNRIRTLVMSQFLAALIGFFAFSIFGPGYFAAAGAMILTIFLMILLDVVHPPAVATALGFAFRTGQESNLLLFGMAIGIIVLLTLMQKVSLWIIAHSPLARS